MPDYRSLTDEQLHVMSGKPDYGEIGGAKAELQRRREKREDGVLSKQLAISGLAAAAGVGAAVAAIVQLYR